MYVQLSCAQHISEDALTEMSMDTGVLMYQQFKMLAGFSFKQDFVSYAPILLWTIMFPSFFFKQPFDCVKN